LFILSVAYLLLNAASYDGEILHAHTGHVLGPVYRCRRYKSDIFPQMGAYFCCRDLRSVSGT